MAANGLNPNAWRRTWLDRVGEAFAAGARVQYWLALVVVPVVARMVVS